MSATLGRIHYRVTLADGRTLDAHPLNVDLLRWDRTAAKHGWPAFQAAGFMFATFLCWSALKREGEIDSTWEVFGDEECVTVVAIDAEGTELETEADADEVDTVAPFPRAQGLG